MSFVLIESSLFFLKCKNCIKLILILTALLLSCAAISVERGCGEGRGVISLGSLAGMPSLIKVPANLPVGGVIQRASLDFKVDCRYRAEYARQINVSLPVKTQASGFNDVAETNIPGVGYRVTINVVSGHPDDGRVVLSRLINGVKTFSYNPINHVLPQGPYFQLTGEIEWVKTSAKIGSGQLGNGAPGKGNFCVGLENYDVGLGEYVSWCYRFEDVTLTAASGCKVTSPATLTVPLPTVNVQELETGTVVETPFSFNLDCSPGTRVLIAMADANNTNNREGALTVRADGQSAKGVGIQIKSGNRDIMLGNEWLVSANDIQNRLVPLSAKYVKLGNNALNAGRVNASATFTLRYE